MGEERDGHTREVARGTSSRPPKGPLFPRNSTCQRVTLSWFHAPRGALLTVEGTDPIPAVGSIIQQGNNTYTTCRFTLSILSLSFSLSRSDPNGTLERETKGWFGSVATIQVFVV
ncbi:hypothetical protein E2542_SST01767 [Spatholobus suberectus]|nr:hypothetical protein E2542_SST01767 [Spatholobus suberectus]